MSLIKHTSKIEFKGCRHSLDFQNKVEEIIKSIEIEKSDGSIYASASFKVVREGDTVETTSKKSEGLGEEALKLFNELEVMAQDLCKKGNDPSKVKAEISIEKEI